MIIDLRCCKQNGQFRGDFQFEFVPKDEISLPNATLEGNAIISGEFKISGRDVFVDGRLQAIVNCECSRCLLPVKEKISIEFSEKFVIQKDEDFYSYSKDRVDLTELAENLFATDFPVCIYCKPDCKGLCYNCGKNFNNEMCDCTIK